MTCVVLLCNSVLTTHSAVQKVTSTLLSYPLLLSCMVMMNRLESGVPARGRCSGCCVYCSQVLPQSCRGAVHWLLCNKQPRQSRYMATCEAVCVCVCVRQCVCVTAVSIPELALSSVMYICKQKNVLLP